MKIATTIAAATRTAQVWRSTDHPATVISVPYLLAEMVGVDAFAESKPAARAAATTAATRASRAPCARATINASSPGRPGTPWPLVYDAP
jgi:hypothetical protein